MAFLKTGAVLLTAFTNAINPYFPVSGIINIQKRYAARKGFRQKALLLKRKLKAQRAAAPKKEPAVTVKRKDKNIPLTKTAQSQKPDPPNDDIFIMGEFNFKKFSISEAVNFHKEFHHPTVFNNPEATISVILELDMVGKKKTQFIKPFSGIASVPHAFVHKIKKEILVFCDPEYKDTAYDAGAAVAGGVEVVKKIEGGVIQPSLYEYILCHIGFLKELTPIRGLLKNRYPKLKDGTLVADLAPSIKKFLYGVEYACIKPGLSQDFGIISCPIGKINMKEEQLEENFKALMKEILKHKPSKEGDFVTYVWCMSPPSTEKFCIDLGSYFDELSINKLMSEKEKQDNEKEMIKKERKKIFKKEESSEEMREEKIEAN